MNSINIKDLELRISLPTVLNAVMANKSIEIDINGEIYIDEKADLTLPIVFKCESFDNKSAIMDTTMIVKKLFKDYKPAIDGAICTIKPLVNWQNIIGMNQDRMLYFDHHNDGVELFEDKQLEDMGWEASALDINYREISEYIEKSCDGFFIFYDNEIQFNGFVIVKDIENTREKVKDFIIKKIKINIEEGNLDGDDLDTKDALEFFGVEL